MPPNSDHRLEPSRLEEEREVHAKLGGLFQAGEAQVWLGDFNALTREDYYQETWDEIARVREANSWESPRVELTRQVMGR